MPRPQKTIFVRVMVGLVLLLAAAPALAQQAVKPAPFKPEVTGEPGAPSTTTTISGEQLPPQKFGGEIKDTAQQSKPYWPMRVVPPKGAPNVLLIMTDDSGYGVPSTFGGVIATPALDRIAKAGLRYTNFHSTALCSPTRAALITGRNHHSVGFGVVSEQATGYPGYDSIITKDKATIGKILKDNGYHTSWFGKNHNTPAFQASAAGPFDQWPMGMGFDYFYGFMGGDTNQWQPANLARNTTYIDPFLDNPNFNLITAMADEAIAYMHRMNTLTPDQPWFIYYVPGGTHAPHHPTKEWVEKIGQMKLFDQGWNKLREQIFENQKKLGVIPANAKLTPWPKDLLKEWDQLTADEKKMFIRQVDVFAAYVAYTDHEIGRVIQAVEDLGKLDNTLIIYINGDNGTSAEGTLVGTPNAVAMFNSVNVPVEDQLKYFYDVWGTDKTYNHMAVGWAWAFDTPFPWTKQIVSHFGGTKQGMAIAWPQVIKDAGGIRTAGRNVFTWPRPLTGTPNGDAPSLLNASYNFKAEVEVPQGGAEGMLITQGGRFGGYGFYVLKGKPVFLWNLVDLKRVRWEGPEELSPGKHTLDFDFKYDVLGMATLAYGSISGIGRSGTGVLKVDGKEVAA